MYKLLDDGVHGGVLDFPGVITCGPDLPHARKLLAAALVDMAETNLSLGESLPTPQKGISDPDADVVEPIHLILEASSGFRTVPEPIYEAA